ncbi:hypothetical protein EG328_008790 [Venturia inaequalis]|uniref:Uncharacterized protein n=1 Tax=Venturia inaequalis TaxID=5025 RepID=A0A8H3UBJ9_VENIN|nr:hypothetical protein EG328_008790 [Venturia inaequalis]KAE9979743.1 hypothetical protein EG327_006906 [Venturia inaequalis]
MNRGNIPGYYFDEEKKKYFKITKTQYAPEGAKYGYDNYKKEIEVKNVSTASLPPQLVCQSTLAKNYHPLQANTLKP